MRDNGGTGRRAQSLCSRLPVLESFHWTPYTPRKSSTTDTELTYAHSSESGWEERQGTASTDGSRLCTRIRSQYISSTDLETLTLQLVGLMSDLGHILARLGISQYLGSFIEEGFETWETVLDITESDLSGQPLVQSSCGC